MWRRLKIAHLENRIEWCLEKAKREGIKHRGLKEVAPDITKANKHIAKASHNLRVMNYLVKGDFSDWAVSTSFYSMYHCLLAILAKYGYESRNQECTFSAVEYLIKNKKINLDLRWLQKIASFENKLGKENIVNLREEFQYGTDSVLEESKLKELLSDTKEFVDIIREILKD